MDDPFADLFGPPKPSASSGVETSPPMSRAVQPANGVDNDPADSAVASTVVPQAGVVAQPLSVMLKEDVRDYIAEAVSASVEDAMGKVIGSLRSVLEQVTRRVESVEGEMRELKAAFTALSIDNINATLNARFARVDESVKEVGRGVQAMRDRAELMEATSELARLTAQSSKKRCEDCHLDGQAAPPGQAAPVQPESQLSCAQPPEQTPPPAAARPPSAPLAAPTAPQIASPPDSVTSAAVSAPPSHMYPYTAPAASAFAPPAPAQPYSAPQSQPGAPAQPYAAPPLQPPAPSQPSHAYATRYAPPLQPAQQQQQQQQQQQHPAQGAPQPYASYPSPAAQPLPFSGYMAAPQAPPHPLAMPRPAFPVSAPMPPQPQQPPGAQRYSVAPPVSLPNRPGLPPQRIEGTAQMSTQQVVQDLCQMGFEKQSVERVISQMIQDRQNIDLNVIVDRLMNGR